MRTRFHILLACLACALPLAVTAGAQAAGAATIPPGLLVTNIGSSTLTSFPLSARDDATPSATVGQGAQSRAAPTGVALDAAGDAWVANYATSTVVEFSQRQLAATGTATPLVTLAADAQGSLNGPFGLAFDPAGDLWVANGNSNTLVEYTPSQLVAGNAQTPAVTLSANGSNSIDTPEDIAFDAAGDLWVPNFRNSTLVEFTSAQLMASGAPNPAVTISSDNTMNRPAAIVFDQAGDLWTTSSGNDRLLEYTPGELVTGAPAPANVLSGGLSAPAAASFDAQGELWVANFGNGSVVEFTPAQLAAGGTSTPADTITGNGTGLQEPNGLAVEEAPTVSSISTERGPTGTRVAIYGTGFYPGSSVDFGGVTAASVSYVSPYELTAVAPAGSGVVDVTVRTGQGTSTAVVADRFTYASAAAVTPTVLVGNDNSNTFSSFPLAAGGDVSPATTLSHASGSDDFPIDGALDGAGDLWVPNDDASDIVEYTRSQLVAGGPATPAVTISSDAAGSLLGPSGTAFDAAGNLWVASDATNTVVEYTKAQLSTGGALVPAVTLAADGSHSLFSPLALGFDAAGDLWVTNGQGGTVVEYAKDQLTAGGAPTPAVTISSDAANSLTYPDALTFDRRGDLWVTNGVGGNDLVEYTPSQFVTGAPTPAVTITSNGAASLDGSDQAQFDAAGDLWVANFNPEGNAGSIVEFTPDQLAASGSPTPVDTISGPRTGLANPWVLVIEQAPTVSAVSPAGGPSGGGTAVTISGTGFYPGSTVDFGGVPATSVSYVSPYELTAVAPAGSGVVDVTVSTGLGTSEVSTADQFAYPASPVTPPVTAPPTGPAPVIGLAPVLVPHVGSLPGVLKVVGRSAGVRFGCSVARCQGTVRLSQQMVVTVHHGRRRIRQVRTVVLGTAHYAVNAGRRTSIAVRLSAAALTALGHARQHSVSARLTVTVNGGKTATRPVVLVLVIEHPKAKSGR